MLVAAAFGLSGQLDAYLMAFALVGFPVTVLLNAGHSALVPALVQAEGQGQRQLLRAAIAGTLLFLGATLSLMALLLPQLVEAIGWALPGDRRSDVVGLGYALIPYYVIAAINLFGYGVLQARRRFIANGSLPAIVPGMTIVLLVLSPQTDIRLLVYGLTLGVGAELLLLQWLLMREGMTLVPELSRGLPALTKMRREFLVLVPGAVVWSLIPLVDQALASGSGEGAIASLAYGARVPAAINGILATAIGVAALPYLSKMIGEKRIPACLYALKRLSWVALAGGAGIAAVLVLTADWVVQIVFERGAFDQNAREVVVPIQQVYAIQLPGLLVSMLAVAVHLALRRGAKLGIVAASMALLHVICAWSLSRAFGVIGIAAAAAIVASVNGAWLLRSAERSLVLSESRAR